MPDMIDSLPMEQTQTADPVMDEIPRKINKEQVLEAMSTLQRYKGGKANLENRIVDNEEWYKIRHWQMIGKKHEDTDLYPSSAWLFNSIANKHADAMDNYPEPAILPREEGDKGEAETLTSILPLIMEQNDFESTYSDAWWYKLKNGTGVYGIFWDPTKHNGLGDISIKQIDLLSLFWEPGVNDIQNSRNLFSVELWDNDVLEERWPQLKNHLGGGDTIVRQYIYDDTVDTSDKSMVVDWYYKKTSEAGDVLHYCKFCGDTVLYASEDDPNYADRGFYDHGLYPFVFDPLFIVEGTPAGFGYIDIMKSPQLYIDKLDQLILKNALMSSKKRFFIRNDGSINEEEFANWDNDFVHVDGANLGEDSIREIQTSAISSIYVQIKQLKVDELKETSGNRDFSQGSTTSGVTAASAIAALQEAGSKLSRDMLKSAYRAYAQICRFAIELIRQFYDEPRYFRILGENGMQRFIAYTNDGIRPQAQGTAFGQEMGYRLPEFDVKIKAQKSSAFSKLSQNELAKELYGAGFFNPQLADQALVTLDMMDFEGKQQVMAKIAQNGTLYQQVLQLQAQVAKMAQIIDMANGTNLSQMVGQQAGLPTEEVPQMAMGGQPELDSLGGERAQEAGQVRNARARAAGASDPTPR